MDKGGGSGQLPPSRLRLVRPVGGLVAGRPDSLRIETTGEHGQLLPAQHPLVVALSGANGLTSTTRVTVPAGATEVEVPIVAAKPSLWQVEVRSDGLYSTSTVITSVAEALAQRHKALAASAHLSHSYVDGACLYFTFAARQPEGRELEHYYGYKRLVTDTIMSLGGTLSHHHAVGTEHRPWMKLEVSPAGLQALHALKASLDPKCVLNPGKLLPEP